LLILLSLRQVHRHDRHLKAGELWQPRIFGLGQELIGKRVGVIGAGLATWLLNMMGIKIGGPVWLSYLVSGFIGACVLIIATRILAPGRWRS
jgi:uncharacterized membrane protein YeaQ/YmgE (transglycosylase-associated protein family)